MSLVALVLLPLLLSPTLSVPVGFGPSIPFGIGTASDYGYDYLNGYYGYDYADYYPYSGYPRTVDYAKENFVRGNPYGATEYGTRDEVTVRPDGLRSPYSRFYSLYNHYNNLRGFNRYPYDPDFPLRGSSPLGSYLPRSSYLGRFSGDALYLR